jgi:hypothetical protein
LQNPLSSETMRVFSIALLALVALETTNVEAFMPSNFRSVGMRQTQQKRAMTVDMAVESDVSIPYDAAARLEYANWCNTYGKRESPARFEVFKENYVAITVMNVAAKKQARDTGDDNPSILALNEYADCTAEEYEAAMNGESDSSTGDVLGKALEAAQSQMAASSALQEAADALAEEEEVGWIQKPMGRVQRFLVVNDAVHLEIGSKAWARKRRRA